MKNVPKWGLTLALTLYLAACGTSKQSAVVTDLATGATRFTVSAEGVIADSATGLEWIAGPDRDTNYNAAEQWVTDCKQVGGGWRMPTRAELKTLYQPGVGTRNMDPAFKISGWWVWGEPRDSSSAWAFRFNGGGDSSYFRDTSSTIRVFGVRSRSRR